MNIFRVMETNMNGNDAVQQSIDIHLTDCIQSNNN
jgi:hypothetical protein